MASPIVNPEVPYTGEIPGGLQLGRMCRIQGVTHPDADRFNINLNLGPSSSNDTALHLSVRLNQGYIARNSYKNGAWQDEQGSGTLPIGQAQSWEIIILVDQNDYKIAVNGQHFCEFPHRLPFNRVTHLLIDGQVSITLISWEGISGIASSESSTISSQLNAEGPQGIPPQQFGVPQGGYGAPGGYGPPGGGYGAPPSGYMPPAPPGAQQESGFDNFLEQAQSVLAGAIKSGAAEKLLGGLLSSGGPQQGQQGQGYAPQNARYGIYPDLPRDLDLKDTPKQSNPGPVERLLSGLLSGGNTQQQQQQQQQQQVPSTGGIQQDTQQNKGIDFGSILSGLLNRSQQQQLQQQQQQNVVPQQSNKVLPQESGTLPGTQQQHGIDFGSLLSGLLSGNQQQSGQVHQPNQVPAGGQIPANTQQNAPISQQAQGIDIGAFLSGLISSSQKPGAATPGSVTAPQTAQQTIPGNIENISTPQPSTGIDINALVKGLMPGGGQHPSQLPPGSTDQGLQSGNKGIDLSAMLSSLLSGVKQQQPADVAPGAPQSSIPANPQQQSHGIDLGSLLSGLLSKSDQVPQAGSGGGTQVPQAAAGGGGFQVPQGGGTQMYDPRPPTGGNQTYDPTPQIGGNQQPGRIQAGDPSKPAAQHDYADVTDQLAQIIAQERNNSQQQASQSHSVPQEQYGQYPQPPQQQQQQQHSGGPLENLLSGFLSSGSHQQPQQQAHGPQIGGGDSIGGLGSMSGILQNFAGQILQPKDGNQRQNY